MPDTSASSAASFDSRSGAKPPSSPTAVARPRSCSLPRSAWKTSAPVRSASPKEPAPTGTTMNSWKSTLLSACAPPFSTFIIGTGQHVRGLAAQIAPEREPDLCRGGLRGRQRHPEDCVRSQPRLVRRAVELDHRAVHGRLIGCVEPAHAVGDLALHVVHCAAHALAVPGRAAVAQLHRLELSGRGARGHRGTPRRAGGEHHIHLDRGIPATVHDLPPVHRLNLAHRASSACARRPSRKHPCTCPRRRAGLAPGRHPPRPPPAPPRADARRGRRPRPASRSRRSWLASGSSWRRSWTAASQAGARTGLRPARPRA